MRWKVVKQNGHIIRIPDMPDDQITPYPVRNGIRAPWIEDYFFDPVPPRSAFPPIRRSRRYGMGAILVSPGQLPHFRRKRQVRPQPQAIEPFDEHPIEHAFFPGQDGIPGHPFTPGVNPRPPIRPKRRGGW